MGKHPTNLLFVLALLLAVSGAFLRSGRVEAVQESITVDDCKISCEKGSPKILTVEWTCNDVVRHKQIIVATPEMMSTAIKPSSSKDGCDGLLVRCGGIYCNDLTACIFAVAIPKLLFVLDTRHQCGCW